MIRKGEGFTSCPSYNLGEINKGPQSALAHLACFLNKCLGRSCPHTGMTDTLRPCFALCLRKCPNTSQRRELSAWLDFQETRESDKSNLMRTVQACVLERLTCKGQAAGLEFQKDLYKSENLDCAQKALCKQLKIGRSISQPLKGVPSPWETLMGQMRPEGRQEGGPGCHQEHLKQPFPPPKSANKSGLYSSVLYG